jgi:hypothetical protein
MDYYEGVVGDFLSSDPTVFVKPQCPIQLRPGPRPAAGEHWYCDVVALSFRDPVTIFLCEVTTDVKAKRLIGRLHERDAYWPEVRAALARDNLLLPGWRVRPWALPPAAGADVLSRGISGFMVQAPGPDRMPRPLVTCLEDVAPWLHTTPPELPGVHAREV